MCGEAADDLEALVCRVCGGPTVVRHQHLPAGLGPAEARGVWRYRGWLPFFEGDRPVTLGEGATPLVRLHRWPQTLGLSEVYAKLEYVGPTGSFKDRGASVLVSHAAAVGARRIVEDSSGNAGAAIAAYAGRAGLECQVYAPASAPHSKLAQIAAYGAELIGVEGSREAVAAAARDAATGEGVYYAGHNSSPYFLEGTKTCAFELVEAFPAGGPDHIVMPVGGGSLFCGTAIAFRQLRDAGIGCPNVRLHLVQSTGCMPLVAALSSGSDRPAAIDRQRTIAGGIVIENPQRGALILREVRASGGQGVAASDAEILAAQADLAQSEGIYMEPTSAAAFAGLRRLAEAGVIGAAESVVVLVTGSGLKDEPIQPS
jgi:threonine synthase